MSYPGEIDEAEEVDTVRLDDETGERREYRTVVKKNRFKDYYDNNWGKTWLVVGCVFLFFFIFVLVWLAYVNNNTNSNEWHVHQIEQRVSQSTMRSAQQFIRNGLYSMGAIFASRKEATLSLCHTGLYTATVVSGQEVLQPCDTVKRTRAMLQHTLSQQDRSQLLDVRFDLQYNIDVGGKGAPADQLYETVHYEVFATYAQFSTVKLLVTSEDLYKKMPRVRQEIVICSNKPGSARQCNHHTSLANMFYMNNTLRVPMEQVSGNATALQGDEMHADAAYSLKQLETRMANNRLFHVLFYREAGDTVGRDDVDDYAEYLALIVEPGSC